MYSNGKTLLNAFNVLLEMQCAASIAIIIEITIKSPTMSNFGSNSQHMLVKLHKCHSFGSNKEACSLPTSTSSINFTSISDAGC